MPRINKFAAVAVIAGGFFACIPMVSAQQAPVSQGGWAVVKSDGTLGKHLNATGVTRVSVGVYDVTFNQPVKHCAYNATIRGDETLLPGYIIVSSHGKKEVQVNTYALVTLLPADFKFIVAVAC